MEIDYNIRGEKLLCDIKREPPKISVLPFGKMDNYEHLTGEEMLLPDQTRLKEQANLT